ncbi:Fc.00g020700.m01.CDS01 [Cosmosporella sp. VM-42]
MSSWNTSPLTWFITGASSGFGLEITRLALSDGHKVIATSRNPSRNSDLIAEVERQGGRWLALDVDDPNCGSIIEDLEKQGTTIDILVNNAGWSIHAPAESFSEDEVRRQMETIYFGPYRLMRAVLPHMRSRKRGLLVNIGSGAGVDGRESMGIYGASKAAMDGLMKIMAKEVAPFNIRTLTVHLGGFDTNFANAARAAKAPFPEAYKGSMTEAICKTLGGGEKFKLDGDHRKASNIIYEMAVGEGVGKGKEGERTIFLGRDMTKTMDEVFEGLKHQIDTFREISDNVYLES